MSPTNYDEAVQKVQQHVESLYHTHSNPNLVYHNMVHTQHVVDAAVEIANHYQLNDADFFIVQTAAWFHDIGYLYAPLVHEAKGAEIAADFLTTLDITTDTITAIQQCILATKLPQSPNNLLQQIVCDADLFHFGTDEFAERSKLMRKEFELSHNKEISKADWRKGSIKLMNEHHYFTDYCRVLLNDKKQENLQKLLKKDAEQKEAATNSVKVIAMNEPNNTVATAQPEKPKKDKDSRPERGIETMFRITSGNNQRLSDMADNKAHILITVNSIILSAIISLVLRKLEQTQFLIYPTFLLLGVSLVTIVIAILATRPSIPSGRFSEEDVNNKKVNLLFFGNFYKMNLDEYAAGMQQVMNSKDFLYSTLIKDVYSQGVVLGRKYRLLRLAYNVFMFGLIAAVLAFSITSALYSGK